MRRLFPILAAAVGMLLMAGFYSGLIRQGDDLGRLVRLAAVALALAIHAGAFVYLWATARRVEAIVGREGLPEWVAAQAEKNRRRALQLQIAGSMQALVGAGFLAFQWWTPIVYGSTVSFQVGFFIFESMAVASQSRLLDELTGPAISGRAAEGP